jgi:hypothetical protein
MWHPNSFLLYHLSRSLFFCSVFSISWWARVHFNIASARSR